MNVPKVEFSKLTQNAIKNLTEMSKQKTTVSQQTVMANYYAYLHSKNNMANETKNYAKILLG